SVRATSPSPRTSLPRLAKALREFLKIVRSVVPKRHQHLAIAPDRDSKPRHELALQGERFGLEFRLEFALDLVMVILELSRGLSKTEFARLSRPARQGPVENQVSSLIGSVLKRAKPCTEIEGALAQFRIRKGLQRHSTRVAPPPLPARVGNCGCRRVRKS